jgi:homoserine dehydrogenase
MVDDHPGVLSQVTAVLGAHDISIASVLQHEPLETNGIVPLVIMTHETSEGAAARACEAIDKLPPVQGKTVRMWVRD